MIEHTKSLVVIAIPAIFAVMSLSIVLLLLSTVTSNVDAFVPSCSSLRLPSEWSSTKTVALQLQQAAYVPDGLTREQYEKIKHHDERKQKKGKNLGAIGPKGFKSRSMQAWQQAYEKGMTGHTFAPVAGYQQKLKKRQIKQSDIPYMVRGGSWDNSDIKGGKRQKWLKADRDYAKGGYKKEQSVSILGSGPGIDWAGKRPRDVNLANGRIPGFS